jgi:HEAT repeat protein
MRAPGAIDAVIALFVDPDPHLRAGAARALWGVPDTKAGRTLLHVALTDRVPYVREAGFENLAWPMVYDIARNRDKALYAAGISKGLRSPDSHDVGGALSAIAFLDKQQAEPVLRRYALDPRPAVRVAAIHAFEDLMYQSAGIKAFLKSRLSDPSPAVREAVSEQLADYSSR